MTKVVTIMIEQRIELIGELPPYYKIADMLLGVDADVDSDGNSESADSISWNELTIIFRKDREQRLEVYPNGHDERFLIVSSMKEDLVAKTIFFLKKIGAAK